jgi:hypothetical protein
METQQIITLIIFLFFIGLIMYIHRQGVKKDLIIKELTKPYTEDELRAKLEDKFNVNRVNYGYNVLTDIGYIDDDFTCVFESVVEVVKGLGIKVKK